MDINSLLSPQDSPASEAPPNISSPHLSSGRHSGRPSVTERKSSGLSQQITPDQITSAPSPTAQYFPRTTQQQPLRSPHAASHFSPHAQALAAAQIHAATAYAAQHPDVARAGVLSFPRTSPGDATTPGSESRSPLEARSPMVQLAQPPLSRNTSTPQMDTLADLAAMQHHQHSARQNAGNLRSPAITAGQVTASQGVTTTASYSPAPIRPGMTSRNATDQSTLSMLSSPRQYSIASLSEEDSAELNQTSATLHESILNYQAHIRVIKLLHKGFINHVHSKSSDAIATDALTYELLADLRQAREAMDSIYPLGEDLWCEWIDDEKALAQTVDERINVMNLCVKAVTDEPSSAKLWRLHGDYMYLLYATANGLPSGEANWTEEDQLVGKEIFTWSSVNQVWERGVVETQWRLNDSNVVWDRYMEILMSEQKREGASVTFRTEDLQQLFGDRLIQPHASWENTFQNFSQLMTSTTTSEQYEQVMSSTNQRASSAKQMWSLRELFELKISNAEKAGNRDVEWEAYSDYLHWEVKKKGIFSGHLVVALYERAITRFSAEATLWEDYVEYLIQDKAGSAQALGVLERATRHCPWSGSLWSHRLLALEAAGKDFREMEQVKHKATRTGILELAGLEELLKVYIAWCGFLRRRAFEGQTSDEDDLDIAEVGIRSALEHVKEIGEQIYGKDQFPGDPHYRLERIHIKFCTQAGNQDTARTIWKSLAIQQKDDYNFWYRWYIWEMMVWTKYAFGPLDPKDTNLRNPAEATSVLKQALQNIETLDWPEQLIAMFTAHCEQHESVTEIQNAQIIVRKLNKEVQKRRQLEQEAAAVQARAQYEQQSLADVVGQTTGVADLEDVPMAGVADENHQSGKRKPERDTDDQPSKKMKTQATSAPEQSATDTSVAKAAQAKRDREHSAVLVKKLPNDTTTTALRKFFRDSGTIVSIKLNDEAGSSTKSATVEFETPQDAQFALTRASRPFEGQEIEIEYASGTTLWVSNYPPEADDKYIRDLFSKFGEIIDIRFPSLTYNTHRRFCYVQFAHPGQAVAATALEGTILKDASGDYKLTARISDPNIKQNRGGALAEGREVFVKGLHWEASEAELREVFGEFGAIERANIPRNLNGKSKGFAFVSFASADEAQAAVEKLSGRAIRGRSISVEIAKAGGAKKTATSVVSDSAARAKSETPASTNGHEDLDQHMNGTAQSPPMQSSATATGEAVASRKERTLFLTNIPDTVNDSRVRAFLEPFGTLKKIILRPDHQGAIVEFGTVADAGRAEMRIPDEATRLAEGKVVKVVSSNEFFKVQPEVKEVRLDIKAKGHAKKDKGTPATDAAASAETNGGTSTAKFVPAQRISRPGVGAGRGTGRRGGLGTKKGGVGLSGPRAATDGHGKTADVEMAGAGEAGGDVDAGSPSEGNAAPAKKSNDDFRTLLMGEKKD